MRHRSIASLVAAAAFMVVVAVPTMGTAADCSDPYGRVTQPSGGQLIVNGTVVTTPLGQPVALSTTGTIDVVIEHNCALDLRLVVTKTAGVGAGSVVHDETYGPLECGTASFGDTVSIGLDGGNYRFDLSGHPCIGRAFRSDGHGGTVLDPPLPL